MQQWSGVWLWGLACAHGGSERPCLACAAAVSSDTVNKKVSQMFLPASLASSSAWAGSITEAWTFRHAGIYSCLLLFLCVFQRWMFEGSKKEDWRRWRRLLLIPRRGNLSLNCAKGKWENTKRTLLKCCRVTGSLILREDFRFGISTFVSIMQLLCAYNISMPRQWITHFCSLDCFWNILMTLLGKNDWMMTSWPCRIDQWFLTV